jgi:hypothetical protein
VLVWARISETAASNADKDAARIAAELLVGPFSDLNNLHSAIVRELGNEIQGNADPVGNGLILMKDHLLQIIHHVFLLDENFVVIGLVALRDLLRVFELVQMLVIAKSDGERFHRSGRIFAH